MTKRTNHHSCHFSDETEANVEPLRREMKARSFNRLVEKLIEDAARARRKRLRR